MLGCWGAVVVVVVVVVVMADSSIHSWRERRWPEDELVRYRFSRHFGFERAQQVKEGAEPLHAGELKPHFSEETEALLDQLDDVGYVIIPDFYGPEKIAEIRRGLEGVPVFLPPPGTSGGRTGGSNLPGKTRCVDEFLVDPRVMDLCEGHLGSVFELSICVLMNIFPGAERQRFHQVPSPASSSALHHRCSCHANHCPRQDDGIWESLAPRPHRPWVLNFLLAVDDFVRRSFPRTPRG